MQLHKMSIVLSGNRVLFGAMAIEAYSSEVGCEALGRHIKAKNGRKRTEYESKE